MNSASDTGRRGRRCWIGVGSNLNREQSIRGAIASLGRAFGALIVSPVYETEAVGFDGDAFLNLVVGIETEGGVRNLSARLVEIENIHGRRRGPDRFSPRTLDLDLLTWGNAVGTIAGRELPRDEILKYAFVLGPLADVAPDERHPADGRCYAELRAALGDGAVLRPFPLTFGA